MSKHLDNTINVGRITIYGNPIKLNTNMPCPICETILQSDSKDHARYALEQALIHRKISREEYNELMGYVLHVMYKEGE